MKIAFISQPWNNVDPPLLSTSIALWTYEVATRLAREHDVIIYAKRNSRRGGFMYENVEYRYISTGIERRIRGLMPNLPGISKTPSFGSPMFYLGYILKIASDIRRKACDIIHIHNFSQFAPIVRRFNPKAKIVLHMHCEWLTQFRPRLIARRLDSIDMIFGSSEYITGKIRNTFPQHAARCHPLPNGVDINHFSRPEKAAAGKYPLLLFIGRKNAHPAVEVLLQAFNRVLEVIPEARLRIIVPDADHPSRFSLGLAEDPLSRDTPPLHDSNLRLYSLLDETTARRVSFAGFPPHHRLPELLGSASVMIHSAGAEPPGVPVLEAMAAGIPVVAAMAGGVSEVVDDGQTGFLVEHNNSDALANALVKLIADSNLRASMGKAAKRKAADFFSWESITDKLLWYYQNMQSYG